MNSRTFAQFQQEYSNLKPIAGAGSSIIRQLLCTSSASHVPNTLEQHIVYEYEIHATQQQHNTVESKFALLLRTVSQNLVPIKNFYVKESQRTALRVAQQGHYSDTYLRTYYIVIDDDLLVKHYTPNSGKKSNNIISDEWPHGAATVTLQDCFDNSINKPTIQHIPLQVCIKKKNIN